MDRIVELEAALFHQRHQPAETSAWSSNRCARWCRRTMACRVRGRAAQSCGRRPGVRTPHLHLAAGDLAGLDGALDVIGDPLKPIGVEADPTRLGVHVRSAFLVAGMMAARGGEGKQAVCGGRPPSATAPDETATHGRPGCAPRLAALAWPIRPRRSRKMVPMPLRVRVVRQTVFSPSRPQLLTDDVRIRPGWRRASGLPPGQPRPSMPMA